MNYGEGKMEIKELPPLREWIKETGIDDVEAYILWCTKCNEAAEEQYRKENAENYKKVCEW